MVSVIIPIYNCEKYLNECISSVLGQTYKDFELILVDDGSTDNSLNICYEFAKKDSRIIVIHQENGGVSSARNKGLKNAKGEFITFVDSDDYVENDWLKMLLTAILANNADVSICGIKFDNKLRCLCENNSLTKDELLFELQKNGLLYSVFNKSTPLPMDCSPKSLLSTSSMLFQHNSSTSSSAWGMPSSTSHKKKRSSVCSSKPE